MKSQPASPKKPAVAGWIWYLFAWWILLNLPGPLAVAQQTSQEPESKQEDNAVKGTKESIEEKLKQLPAQLQAMPGKLRREPIEWLIGPYIPVQGALWSLTNEQREQVYLRHTFLTAGSYLARAFSASLNQARGEPYQWGGGLGGYGTRYAAKYGEFVIQNSLAAAGDAALGYEPRYDFCRCRGFWPRTRHALSRNFVAYNRTERELRPRVALYGGAFAAGMLYGSWLPGQHSVWKSGGLNVVSQAGVGSGYNFVSEFALDILHKFHSKK